MEPCYSEQYPAEQRRQRAAARSFTYRHLNPALGLVQKLGGGVTVFGGYAQNNRVPTILELGCADPAQPCRLPAGLQADPYLKQVVSHAFETGVRWRRGKDTEVTATLYRIDNHDDILFLRAPNTQFGYFANFDRTRNQGLDLTARQRVGDVTLRLATAICKRPTRRPGSLRQASAPSTSIPACAWPACRATHSSSA